jgi:alpha-L-rhamnosidase
MKTNHALRILFCLVSLPLVIPAAQAANGPVHLQVDHLSTPLGLDDPAPGFSWQLNDPAQAARQSGCEVLVASRADLLDPGKADLWDSGKISSSQTQNLRYAGAALKPSTRYFWRVLLWNAEGKAYAGGESSWWETGLMDQANWRATWIGYETAEEAAVRKAPAMWIVSPDASVLAAEHLTELRYAFRKTVELTQPVRRATLYATGQDTVAAWVNGEEALAAAPFPPYKQMPWQKFVQADVTRQLHKGANQLAIELVHYLTSPSGSSSADAPAMIATLCVEYADGSVATFQSDPQWKTAIHAPEGWQKAGFQAAAWKSAATSPHTPGHPWIPDSVKSLRDEFELSGTVKSARLYATALGVYEIFLNGSRVSEDRLAPGWTDYRQHVLYQTYDVTALLKAGSNAIGALLAPGWYSTPLQWYQQPNNYGDTPPALLAQLRIEFSDGSVQWIASDSRWKASTSFILHSEIYDGESQDGRLNDSSWSIAGFRTAGWKNAEKIEPHPLRIEAQSFAPIRVERTMEAKAMTSPKPGVYVYDFGQNFTGVALLRVSGPAGTHLRLRYAEILNSDGTLYTDNLRTAKATDTFVLTGKGIEEFTPEFTFHGFRYVELTGLPSAPSQKSVIGIVFHTDAPFTAKLRTGSEMLNQLWSNIQWGQRSNFIGLPTDCPQRDERLGWAADAQVFWRAASYNMDLAAFSRKFAADLRGTQSGTPYYGIFAPGTATAFSNMAAGWSDAGVIIPYTSWLQSGDAAIIEENWAAMEKYLDAIAAANPDHLWKKDSGIPYGDWLSPEGRTDQGLVATAYWAYDVTLMQRMAHATGRAAAEAKYAALFDAIRAAFGKAYVKPDGFVGGADNSPSPFGQINNPDAKSKGGDTQTGYVLALHMNLLPEDLRMAAANKLAAKIEANHGLLATGFLGTPYLLEELAAHGHRDLAVRLLLNTAYPSWGYLVEHGATTMWERWNGDQMKSDPSMNSYNHYAYGAVGDWLARSAAGVDATPLDPGFHTVVLRPVFDERLGHLAFNYDSPYGRIHSHWTVETGAFQWHISLPANTSGWLPLTAAQAASWKLNGKPLTESREVSPGEFDGQTGYRLDAGSYSFTIAM